LAIAAPMPRVPPVTNATRDIPHSSQSYFLLFFIARRFFSLLCARAV
jgi:hypothetical protein